MGYCMSQEKADFFIPKAHHEAALKKIKELLARKDLMSGSSSGGGLPPARYFAWVDMDGVAKAQSLNEALKSFRWAVGNDEEGNTSTIRFIGEKLGDDEHLFTAIAEFVRNGSYIEMRGEDGSRWRWIFTDGKVTEKVAKMIWD